jgi:hypothetical protein
MDVRLSEFAEIVGTSPATIRSAIVKPDDLPFDDYRFRVRKDAGEISSRIYTVADAFAWFLADEIPAGFGITRRRMSTFVRRSWGIPDYVAERIEAGADVGNRFLIMWTDPEDHPTPGYRFGSEVSGAERAIELKAKRSNVMSVDLDRMFRQFVVMAEYRGWRLGQDGFQRVRGA